MRGLAVTLGWLERARTIAERLPDGPVHGWVALWDGHVARIAARDPGAARAFADRASRIADRHGSVELAMLARALDGLARVDQGDVAEGMRLLDEATAAALAEMSDLDAAGTTCCFLIHACQSVRDYERGSQWTARIKTFAERFGIRPLLSACEPTFAALLVGEGAWREAEEMLRRAEGELSGARPFALPEVCEVLGELRRRQGTLDEALALFDRAPGRSAAMLGRAGVALERGEVREAADLAERFLRATAAENWVGRATALALLVDVRLAGGGCGEAGAAEAARSALAALSALAERVSLPFVRALLSQAEGRVRAGAGRAEEARRALEDAVDAFAGCSAPWEEGRARVDLARVLLDLGRADSARREAERAVASFERLGARAEARRARELLASIERGNRAGGERGPTREPGRGTAPPSVVTARERQVLRLAAEGLSEREIAGSLGLSEHTVHRHVANVLRKVGAPTRTAAVAWALKAGLL